MRRLPILAFAAVLTLLAVPTTASAATVSLTVETHATDRAGLAPADAPAPVPGTASCTVEVSDGADGGEILDQATEDGCIAGWDYDEFDGEGRFVTAIDRWQAPGYTCLALIAGVPACDWWEHHVNGEPASFGIDGYSAEDGDDVRWLYRNTI